MKLRAFAEGASAALVVSLVVIGLLNSWSAEAWAALAAWITAAVAVAAGYLALHQLGEARNTRLEQARLRKEEAQPYVVAYMELSAAASVLVELVIKNFGMTAAHDVRLTITPAPERAIDRDTPPEQRHAWLPERIPILVPGQEWRTLWDSGLKRYENGQSLLPEVYAATVSYADFEGELHDTVAVLDWRMLADREGVEVYGEHHAAKALRDISKLMARWKEGATGGLRVYVRDGDAKDARIRADRNARLAERRARETTGSDDPKPSA